MARIAIIGPGAIGGTLAGNLLKQGNHELVLAGRRPADGLEVRLDGGATVTTGPVVAEAAGVTAGFDWIFVATKTYAAAETGRWLQALMGAETRVAIFQNGVEHRERFREVVGDERLVPVVIDCPAERPTPDTVVQRGPLVIKVEDNDAGRELRALFAGVDERIALMPDFTTAAWWKLTRNSVGLLNAMTLQPNGVLHQPGMREVALGIARECAAVGRAVGARLDAGVAEDVVALILGESRDGVNSLLADRLARRPTELDARNGVVVRFGRRLGVATPLNAMGIAVVAAQVAADTSAGAVNGS